MVLEDRREEGDRLENYVLALGIRGLKRWDSPWDKVYRGASNLNLEALNAFREEILTPLRPLYRILKDKERNIRDMSEAVADYLAAGKIEQKIERWGQEFEEAGEYAFIRKILTYHLYSRTYQFY